MNRVIVNCISVKKKAGGAFQIGQNFIKETLKNKSFDWYYWLSEDLAESLSKFMDLKSEKVFIFPTQPDFTGSYLKIKFLLKRIEKQIDAQLIYTVASPSYFRFKTPEIMRYANAWFVNSNEFAFSKLSLVGKLKMQLLTKGYHYLLRQCNYYITQTEVSKNGILKVVRCDQENIRVVSNVLPPIYKSFGERPLGEPLSARTCINILYVAAPHPNKNIEITLPTIKQVQADNPQKKISLHLTLPEGEFLSQFKKKAQELNLTENIINHGYCTQQQIAELFYNADIFFFPTLLETFSLSLLESLFFNVPIVATDFGFNKEVAGDAALYIQPNDSKSASAVISQLINNDKLYGDLQSQRTKVLASPSFSFFDYEAGFKKTLDFFAFVINKSSP